MAGKEDLLNLEQTAEELGMMRQNLAKQVDAKGRDSMCPPPLKPGEIMYCSICGKKMLPKDFSTDIEERKWEFKWRTHIKCKEDAFRQADLNTPGLMAERGGEEYLERQRKELSRILNKKRG